MADVQSNIQVSIDTTQALASIKNLQRQISAFHTSMAKSGAAANAVSAQMQQTLINSINATGKFAAEIRTIKTTTESFTSSLEKNKFSLGEYFRYAGGASKTFGRLFKTEFDTINKVARENVKDLQTQYIKLGRDASGAMKSIAVRPLSLDMNDLATKTMIASEKQALLNQLLKQGSTNLLNFGKNTQWAGRQLMVGFTLPLVALGSAASKTFMEMETQAIRFKKVYGDLFTPTAESQQALKDIQELGKEFTKYGIAVADTVSLAAEAAAAGFKGADLQRQTAAATKLSILGQVESQKALETTIALQNAFSMSSADLAKNIDFLNAVENQTVLSLDDMSTAIPKAAPVIQQLGGDVKDLAFFMTAMKEGGINASEGANALKSGLASMINPTGKASAMLESFGINIKKIVVDNKGDLKKTVIDFATALNKLDPLNRAQAIEQMFGKFQFARLSTLFANVTKDGTQASRVLDLAGASVQQLAALSEKELGMTSESAMNKFKGAVENLKLSLVPLGEEFLKAVTPIAEFITKILDKFNGLSDGTKKIIVTITGIVAGLGPVFLMTFGLLANGIANIIKGFTAVKTLFNKTGQSSAVLGTEVKYMTTEQRNAAAVAASLDQIHRNLAQTFTSETAAVDALTRAYQRAIAAQSQFVPVAPPLTRGPIKRFAGGKPAVVGGTGNKDSELSLLMPGETVIPTAMSKKYGGLINAMIADRIPGYSVGKPRPRSASLYGGQSLEYSGLGVFAPGNTSASTLGMDRAFLMEGDDFLRSLTASAVGGGATLDNPTARLTAAASREYAAAVESYMPRIVDVLRTTTSEMEQNGENISSIEDITKKARPKLDKIFGEMTAQGGRAASSAKALSSHLFFPTEAEMGGQFGETRVPGARYSSSKPGVIKSTMYRIKKSPFQSRVRTAYRQLFGSNPVGSYAHMNESRMLGEDVPLRGGALALPESERAPLAARVRAQGTRIKSDFIGGIFRRKTNAEKAKIRQSGAEDKREYVKGIESVDAKDPYMQTRDRKSPHAQAAKDGRDDAAAYITARDKALTQAGKKRRVATRAQGPAPIGVTPQPGATILPIVPGGPTGPNQNTPTRTQSMFKNVAGRMSGVGGGMGLMAANMGLSMAPDFTGKGVLQGTLTGANLGMIAGPKGMAVGAVLGLLVSTMSEIEQKLRETAAGLKSVFTPSTELISLLGDTVLDTSLKITNLATTSKDLKDSFGLVSPEVQALIDAIGKLPEDNPLITFIDKLKDPRLGFDSLVGSVRSQVTTAIATGGLDPKNAQAYVQAILAASNRTKDFAAVWKSVSKDVATTSKATTVSFNKLDQQITKNNESWLVNADMTDSGIKKYGQFTTTQKILANQLLDLFSITSNGSLTFDQINERIAALESSSLDGAAGVIALSNAIMHSGNADAIARLNQITTMFREAGQASEMTAGKIMQMNLALQVTTPEAITAWAREKGYRRISPLQQMERYLNSSEFKDLYKQYKELVSPPPAVDGYQDATDGVDGLSKAATAYLKILDKEINGLEAKRDAQKSLNDESQRQIDLQMKMRKLANEAVLAKISGDYLQAAALEQEAKNTQAEFNLETELRKKDAEIARLKARAEAIRGGADLTKAETAKLPKKFASGGMIRGAGTGTSDSIPAYLSNGEYVVKASAVRQYGTDFLDKVNTQKFADGGLASYNIDDRGYVKGLKSPHPKNWVYRSGMNQTIGSGVWMSKEQAAREEREARKVSNSIILETLGWNPAKRLVTGKSEPIGESFLPDWYAKYLGTLYDGFGAIPLVGGGIRTLLKAPGYIKQIASLSKLGKVASKAGSVKNGITITDDMANAAYQESKILGSGVFLSPTAGKHSPQAADIVDRIVESTSSSSDSLVSSLSYLKTNPLPHIQVGPAGKGVKGWYEPGTRTVQVPSGPLNTENIFHEIFHDAQSLTSVAKIPFLDDLRTASEFGLNIGKGSAFEDLLSGNMRLYNRYGGFQEGQAEVASSLIAKHFEDNFDPLITPYLTDIRNPKFDWSKLGTGGSGYLFPNKYSYADLLQGKAVGAKYADPDFMEGIVAGSKNILSPESFNTYAKRIELAKRFGLQFDEFGNLISGDLQGAIAEAIRLKMKDGGLATKDGWLQRWAKSISGQPGAEMFGTAPLLRMLAGLGIKKNILGASQVPLSLAGAGIGQKIFGNLGKAAFYLPNKINQFRNQSRVNKMIKSGMWHGSQPTGLHGEDYLQGTNILEGAEAYDPFYGMGFFGTSSKAEANLYASGLNSFSNWGESFGSLNRIVGAPRGKYVDFTRGSKSLKWQHYGLAKALGVKNNRSMSNFMPENLGDIMSAQGLTGGIMNRINAGRTSEDIQKALWLAWSRPAGVITKEGFADGGLATRPKFGKKKNWFQRYVDRLTARDEKLPGWARDPLYSTSLLRKIAGTDKNGSLAAVPLFALNFMGAGIPGKLGLLGKGTVAASAGAKAATATKSVVKPIFSKMTSSLGKIGAAKMAGKLDEQAALHAAGELVDPIYANKVVLDTINSGMMESARAAGRRTPTQMGNAAPEFADEHVDLTTASLLLGSDLGSSLRKMWGAAFDEMVKAGDPTISGMTKKEFFVKLTKAAPGVATRYSEDPASDFVRSANNALMKSLGFKAEQAVAMYRSAPGVSGKSVPGYYSLNERFAQEYGRQYYEAGGIRPFDEATGGLYQANITADQFPSPIGFGGFLDEYSAVLGKEVTKGATKISGEKLKGAWVRGFPLSEYFEAKPIVMTDELDAKLTPIGLELLEKYPLLSVYDMQKMLPPGPTPGTRIFDFQRLEKLWWDKQPLAYGSDPQFAKLDQFIKYLEEYGKAIGQDVLVPRFAKGGLIKGPGTGLSDSIRATLGYAGGGSIRVSNGEYIVKASSVRDYGVKTMDAINNGTATIGTNSGGTVYNINMPITSNNANAEGVANEVIRKLKLEVSKNNKSNKVGL